MKLFQLGVLMGTAGVLLAGCGAGPVKPSSGVKTTFIFNNTAPIPFRMGLFKDDYDCFGRTDTALAANDPPVTIVVDRRPYQSVLYQHIAASGFQTELCTGVVTIHADGPGPYRVMTNSDGKVCELKIAQQDGEGNWRPVEATHRVFNIPVGMAGPWCAADKQFQGSSVLVTPRE